MFRSVLFGVLVCWHEVSGQVIPSKTKTADGDYNSVNTDGSFDFGYANSDRGASYHVARGNAARVVGGRFGSRDPATGAVKETVYTAGPRGFRAKGPLVHRKMDLDQRPRGPIGNRDDPYFDPSEDPSYDFQFDTRGYSKSEHADSRGDVKGHYSFVDDVGERHDVNYIAGRDTGFHVSSAHPDGPATIGSLFHRAPLVRGEARPRGRTSVQRGLDGSYRFISAGPDQRRTESSDAHGNVRGSYTFLDDKGVQRSVHYIAGPGIGYRIVKNNKDPYIPAYFPTVPSAYDPDFAAPAVDDEVLPTVDKYDDGDSSVEDIFVGPDGTSASGHVKPPPFSSGGNKGDKKPSGGGNEVVKDPEGGKDRDSGYGIGGSEKPSSKPGRKPGKRPGRPNRPTRPGGPTTKPYVPPSPFRPTPRPGSSSPGLDTNEAGVDDIAPGKWNGYRPDNGEVYRPDKGDVYRPGKGDGYSPGKGEGYSPGKGEGYSPGKGEGYTPSKGEGYSPGKGDGSSPGEGGGYRPAKGEGNRPDKEGNYGSDKDDYGPVNKPGNGEGPEYGVGFNVDHTEPGTTIIRNIGEDYFGVPPGVAVRAHVQSIDLYPFGSKRLTPSEAIEKVKA